MAMKRPKILIVDDEKNIRRTLSLVLEGEGYEAIPCATGDEALAYIENETVDVIILDLKLPGTSGAETLSRIRSGPEDIREVPVIVISGHASTSEAIETVRLGATDFFEKPLDRNAILVRVANCLKQRRLTQRVQELHAMVDARHELLGESPVMQSLFAQIAKVAPTKTRVLITGESGTGKELIARALHRMSPRAEAPFVKVNCAAIPSELIESELFGHEKGAFTGAIARKSGQFELADSGTIFLDEIGDMTLSAQAKVLRVLQSGELTRVGGQQNIEVDVRVLAATNKDLDAAVAQGAFREDLYFRLNVVPLHSPALRERLSDVPLLLHFFIDSFCRENGYPQKSLGDDVLQVLQNYTWPGNVRELRNMAERLVIMSAGNIQMSDLPESITRDAAMPLPSSEMAEGRPTLREFREMAERKYILETLSQCDGNISRAAQLLGVERTNLHKKIKSLQIKRPG